MRQTTGISRRIAGCIRGIQDRDHELALVNLFPALDKTAKKRRSRAKVGERIRGFITDEEALISAIAIRNVFKNCQFGEFTFSEAIYKFGRTAIAHEGELDPRLTFNDNGVLEIGATWNLPSSYISALCISVILAPENAGEVAPQNPIVHLVDQSFELNTLWGKRHQVVSILETKYGQIGIFD